MIGHSKVHSVPLACVGAGVCVLPSSDQLIAAVPAGEETLKTNGEVVSVTTGAVSLV